MLRFFWGDKGGGGTVRKKWGWEGREMGLPTFLFSSFIQIQTGN